MSNQSRRSFTIRRADSNDGEAILACLAAAFAPYRNNYTPAGFADTVLDSESVQRRLREMCVLVAVSQGSGVASALLQAAEAEVRSQHCKRVTLDTTDPLARAMRFYARHGFTRSGRVSDFFGMPQHEWVKFL